MKKFPIYLKVFKTQYEMTSTLIRFQEYYESPKFRNKIFTLDDYMDYYAKEFGNFDYFSKVRGMNIPGHIFRFFIYNTDYVINLRDKEEKFLIKLEEVVDQDHDFDEDFYLIATHEEDKIDVSTLKHEFVHGCFYHNKKYKKDVLKVLDGYWLDKLEENLRYYGGYHPSVIPDELNAFILTGWRGSWYDLLDSREIKEVKNLQIELDDCFKNHFQFSLLNARKENILKLINVI